MSIDKLTKEQEAYLASRENNSNSTDQSLGYCPKCGAEVIEGKKDLAVQIGEGGAVLCFGSGKILTPNQVRRLLRTGKTPLIKGFKSKAGQSFAAYLIWENAAETKLAFKFKTS